jgi:hypothetical protein
VFRINRKLTYWTSLVMLSSAFASTRRALLPVVAEVLWRHDSFSERC